MSEVIPVAFGAKSLRATSRDGVAWFITSDVGAILEIKNIRQRLQGIPEKDKGVLNVYTRGGMQRVSVVSESGFYRLITMSRTAAAETFKSWVFDKVIPAIRTTGYYSAPRGPFALPGAAELYLEGADGPEPNKITEPFAEKEREEFAQARAKATGHSVELLRPLVHRVMERELREKKA